MDAVAGIRPPPLHDKCTQALLEDMPTRIGCASLRDGSGTATGCPPYLYPFCTVLGTQQYKVGVDFGLF